MRTLLSEWTFHKAGQGCFYSGLINAHGKDKFCFVFDCGSTKGAAILRQEIKDFKTGLSKIEKKEIDLLVLSHYDADHVNQLPVLLKDTSCKIAVLPYLTNGERLNVYFNQPLDDGTDDDDHFRFITDPAGYLSDLGVERIIFIDGNDEEAESSAANKPGPPGGFHSDRIVAEDSDARRQPRRGIMELSLDANVRLRRSGADADPEKMEFIQRAGSKAEFAKGYGSIDAGIYWEFFFYEKEQPDEMIWNFREKLRKAFGIALAGDYPSYDELVEMTRNTKARGKLKSLHISFFGDTNTSGLVVMHGPLGQRHTECFRTKPLYDGKYCSTLLNGDCDLRQVAFPPYIRSAMSYIRIFQVPHHGSWYSWHSLRELDDLTETQMVVNYGTANKHKHPHAEVTEIIFAQYPMWVLKHNTEKKRYKYHLTSYI